MLTKTGLHCVLHHFLSFEPETSERRLMLRPPIELDLRSRAEVLAESVAQAGLPVPYLGVTPLFLGHRVYRALTCEWVLTPVAEDPLYHDRDGYPIPRAILRHLKAIQRAGIEFDALYVAHEVERGVVREGGPIPLEAIMPPPPRAVQEVSRKLGNAAGIAWEIAAAPLAVSAMACGAMVAAGLVALPLVAAAASMCAMGDPILFGAVVAPGKPVRVGEPAAWFLLAAWNYE